MHSERRTWLPDVVEGVRHSCSRWWERYWCGDAHKRYHSWQCGCIDRMRPCSHSALNRPGRGPVFTDIAHTGIPLVLICDRLPDPDTRVRNGSPTAQSGSPVVYRARDVLPGYARNRQTAIAEEQPV